MPSPSRRRSILVIVLVALVLLVILLLSRCHPKPETTATVVPGATATPAAEASQTATAAPSGTAKDPVDVLTPATIEAPAQVDAGANFTARWTGPNNKGDYLTIVKKRAADEAYDNYSEIGKSNSVELTAPIEPGDWEVRYRTPHSHVVLARSPIIVKPTSVALTAADEVVLGSPLSVTWTGPNNAGDFITLVPKDTPDANYGNYTYTSENSPLKVVAPVVTGDAELRYMTGQGGKILGRRAVKIVSAAVTLSAPMEATAGSDLIVEWTGPNNPQDYLTVVPAELKDGLYGNYTYTTKGSPMTLLLPIMAGDAEVRYMTGQGSKVLQRRPLKIVAATITLDSASEAQTGAAVTITWTGPNNTGDYVTIVRADAKDGSYDDYALTRGGGILTVKAPKQPGDAEVRYMSGQGSKVLKRRPIKILE